MWTGSARFGFLEQTNWARYRAFGLTLGLFCPELKWPIGTEEEILAATADRFFLKSRIKRTTGFSANRNKRDIRCFYKNKLLSSGIEDG